MPSTSAAAELPPLATLRSALRHHQSALELKGSHSKKTPLRLQQLDTALQGRFKDPSSPELCTKATLTEVLEWKLARGKFRPTLPKLLASNDEKVVEKCLKEASKKVKGCSGWKEAVGSGAIEKVAELKGVGPATASAFLSFLAPKLFPFFSDEAAAFFPSLSPLKYTLPQYKSFVTLMTSSLEAINTSRSKSGEAPWSFAGLEKALWTFAVLRREGQEALLDEAAETKALSKAHPVDAPAAEPVKTKRKAGEAPAVEETSSRRKRTKR